MQAANSLMVAIGTGAVAVVLLLALVNAAGRQPEFVAKTDALAVGLQFAVIFFIICIVGVL